MAMGSTIFGQKSPHEFQTHTHQILLLAGLDTLINSFITKPKNYLFYQIRDLLTLFKISCYFVSTILI